MKTALYPKIGRLGRFRPALVASPLPTFLPKDVAFFL
jgi:hypothetical protein